MAAYLRSVSTRAPSGPAWRHPYAYLLALSSTYDPPRSPYDPPASSNDPLGSASPPPKDAPSPGGGDALAKGGEPAGCNGTLTVTGFVRGRPLGADRLVHITGVGTFAVECVTRVPGPRPDPRTYLTQLIYN